MKRFIASCSPHSPWPSRWPSGSVLRRRRTMQAAALRPQSVPPTSSLGRILVDSQGRTLYLFEADKGRPQRLQRRPARRTGRRC